MRVGNCLVVVSIDYFDIGRYPVEKGMKMILVVTFIQKSNKHDKKPKMHHEHN